MPLMCSAPEADPEMVTVPSSTWHSMASISACVETVWFTSQVDKEHAVPWSCQYVMLVLVYTYRTTRREATVCSW